MKGCGHGIHITYTPQWQWGGNNTSGQNLAGLGLLRFSIVSVCFFCFLKSLSQLFCDNSGSLWNPIQEASPSRLRNALKPLALSSSSSPLLGLPRAEAQSLCVRFLRFLTGLLVA